MAMMLITAFGASIGGMGTPVGTPPNLIGIGMLEKMAGIKVSFFQWMAIGVPVVMLMFTAMIVVSSTSARSRACPLSDGSTVLVQQELARLGPAQTRANATCSSRLVSRSCSGSRPAFSPSLGLDANRLCAVLMPRPCQKASRHSLARSCCFVLPVDWRARRFTLTWDEAVRIDWGIVLLYGGGLALGELAFATGLAKAMGEARHLLAALADDLER